MVVVLKIILGGGLLLLLSYYNKRQPSTVGTSNTTYPIVTILEGQIRGKSNVSRDGRQFFEFLGIRYANWNGRFQAATPPGKFLYQNATSFGPSCLTHYAGDDGSDNFEGVEDCFFLNVYTPKLPIRSENQPYPVMVFFHEGGFLYGSGSNYNPRYLMDEDIVLVTVNYRLGALGFLSTEDENAPGNAGLKDQVKALEWIQRNVKFFNGNPNLVTIWGYSAGGASVTYHLLSEMSHGLFHRAIAQSGSALNPWAFAPKPLTNTKILAETVQCNSPDTKTMVSCLQGKDAKDIVKWQRKAFVKWFVDPLYVFVPSVEKKTGNGKGNFITQTPKDIVRTGKIVNYVPLLTGCVKEDGLLLHGAIVASNASLSSDMEHNWERVAPITFFYDDIQRSDPESGQNISKRIKKFYFEPNDSIGWKTLYKISNIYSDRWFLKGVKDFAKSFAQITQLPVYNYISLYNKLPGATQEYLQSIGITEKLASPSHGDDLLLLFQGDTEIRKDSEQYKISKTVVKLWTNFARLGDPLGASETGAQWPPLNTSDAKLKWFQIDDVFQMMASNFTDRSDFWNSVPS